MSVRPIVLNTSGAITTPYVPYPNTLPTNPVPRLAEIPLQFIPYVEEVTLPVVSVDSSALYTDTPEKLVTLSTSQGAALTFFCDSVSGGSDYSGDGSFNNPWRSLNKASSFLSCTECMLAGYEYIQVKVKGCVDYLEEYQWDPLPKTRAYGKPRLIVAGWDSSCFIGNYLDADYIFNASVGHVGESTTIYSDCHIASAGRGGACIDCVLEPYGTSADVLYNCSDNGNQSEGYTHSGDVVYGGSFCTLYTSFAYATVVTHHPTEDNTTDTEASWIISAGVNVTATVSASTGAGGYYNRYTAIHAGRSCLLRNCTAIAEVSISSSGDGDAGASACAIGGYAAVISGGTAIARARASHTNNDGDASAAAWACGVQSGTASGVYTETIAEAAAVTNYTDGLADTRESEVTGNLGSYCAETRRRYYSNGVLVSSSVDSDCW